MKALLLSLLISLVVPLNICLAEESIEIEIEKSSPKPMPKPEPKKEIVKQENQTITDEKDSMQKDTKNFSGKIMYVTDNGDYFLREKPSDRVAAKGSVKAGDPVKVLDQRNGFMFIEDIKGRQRWISARDLQEHESYKSQVKSLQKINEDLRHKLANIDTEQARELKELHQKHSIVSSELTEAKKTLEEQSEKIKKLTEENEDLASQIDNSEQQVQIHWVKVGAMLIGIGLLLGVILVYMPKPHRRRKDIW